MRIGWYVHHQGSGHLQRFRAVRAHLPGVTGLSSLPRPGDLTSEEWIELAADAPAAGDAGQLAGGTLHWAPLRHAGLRDRMASIAAWIARERPDALVVDVSVEVALYARLMGVPVVWIGQRGVRTDVPHRSVYRFADVLVPWTSAVRGRTSSLPPQTHFCGAFSRLDGRSPTPSPGDRRVLLIVGHGGSEITDGDRRAAQAATPGWSWSEPRGAAEPDELWALLMASDVVVGSASTNVVAEVATARRPFVCLPQARPFDEQRDQADALVGAGLAESHPRWPDAREWDAVLTRAADRDPERWSILHDGYGAQRVAGFVADVACASR